MSFLAGACITACRGTGRDILALEGNKDIFDAILKPMMKPVVVTPAVETVGEAQRIRMTCLSWLASSFAKANSVSKLILLSPLLLSLPRFKILT